MPSNADFTFRILIGGVPVTEYVKDGFHYIECNLCTAVSYKQKSTEVVNGEIESQDYPVTPYEIEIESPSPGHDYYYRVFVDGVKVKGLSLEAGGKRRIKGFRDGNVIRELLFSMPRFAKDESDRLTYERLNKVSQIEVECWEAELKESGWKLRKKQLDFTQANKKDSFCVTEGKFTMATSKAGRVVCSRKQFRFVDNWRRKTLRSSLVVLYRMGHELKEMGFELEPLLTLPESGCNGTTSQTEDGNNDMQILESSDATIPAVKVETGESTIITVRCSEPVLIDLTTDEDVLNER